MMDTSVTTFEQCTTSISVMLLEDALDVECICHVMGDVYYLKSITSPFSQMVCIMLGIFQPYDLDLLHDTTNTCNIIVQVTRDWQSRNSSCRHKQMQCITVGIIASSCPELTQKECYLISKTASVSL